MASPFGSQLGSDALVNPLDLTANTSTQQTKLGTRAAIGGRSFRYILNGGVSTVVASLYQAPAQLTNHQAMAVTATSVGATVVNVTPGASTGAANLYAEGLLLISTTPGFGYGYSVSSHPAISSSVAFNVTLADAIQVALTASSKADLVSSPYANVIVNPTTPTNTPVGVSPFIVTNAQYGWIQTGGICSTLIDDAITVGVAVAPSETVAGAVTPANVSAAVFPQVGICMETGVDTSANAVLLMLP